MFKGCLSQIKHLLSGTIVCICLYRNYFNASSALKNDFHLLYIEKTLLTICSDFKQKVGADLFDSLN